AEFRLNLRIDNADERLTPIGLRIGLVTKEQWDQYADRQARIKRVRAAFNHTQVDVTHSFFVSRGMEFRSRPSLVELLRRPEIRITDLIGEGVIEIEPLRREDIVSIET